MSGPMLRTARARSQDGYAARRVLVSAGSDPFQQEHELADALLRLLVAHSRYGVAADADRLGLIQHIVVLLAHEVAEHVERLRGNAAARAFRRALARKWPQEKEKGR